MLTGQTLLELVGGAAAVDQGFSRAGWQVVVAATVQRDDENEVVVSMRALEVGALAGRWCRAVRRRSPGRGRRAGASERGLSGRGASQRTRPGWALGRLVQGTTARRRAWARLWWPRVDRLDSRLGPFPG